MLLADGHITIVTPIGSFDDGIGGIGSHSQQTDRTSKRVWPPITVVFLFVDLKYAGSFNTAVHHQQSISSTSRHIRERNVFSRWIIALGRQIRAQLFLAC